MTFFRNFLCCCTSTHRNETFLSLSNFHIFSRSEKSWGDKQNVNFLLKWRHRPKKKTFFGFFFLLLHIFTSRRNFFVSTKISYLQPFREIMGGQRIRKFSAKMTPQAKKMTFFRIFFSSVAHLHVETILFCFYQNFISSAVQRNQGGDKEKALHQRRTTNNDERRTTNYVDDDNSPPGFFQNPRANNIVFAK